MYRFREGARSERDDSLDRLNTAGARGAVYNPWPLLADESDLSVAWSQPLLRGLYLPVVRPWNATERTTASWYHETLHVSFDFTPANEWARVCLAGALNGVQQLIELPQGSPADLAAEHHRSIDTFNGFLTDIAAQTVFAEELMATALTSIAMDNRVGSNTARGDEAAAIEGESVTTYALMEGCSGFDLTYPNLKRVLVEVLAEAASQDEVAQQVAATALGRVMIFLEAVQTEGTWPAAVDSHMRSEALLVACGSASGRDVIRWVSDAAERAGDLRAWETTAGVAESLKAELAPMSVLLELTRRPVRASRWRRLTDLALPVRRPDLARAARRRTEYYWTWPGHEPDWAGGILFPVETAGGTWFVCPELVGKHPRRYMGVLGLEGLRQQLELRLGFRCPFVEPGVCWCKQKRPAFRQVLEDLQTWAGAGAFGEGTWTALPAPCA